MGEMSRENEDAENEAVGEKLGGNEGEIMKLWERSRELTC